MILTFKQFLVEDAQSDKVARDIALKVFDRLNGLFNSKKSLLEVSTLVKSDGKAVGIAIPFNNVKRGLAMFKDDNIAVTLQKVVSNENITIKGLIEPLKNGRVIRLYCLPENYVVSIENMKEMKKLFEKNKETFLHEFIHFLDSKRWKEDFFKSGTLELAKSGDITDYISSDKEYNAYAQQIIFKIDNILNKLKPEAKLAFIMKAGKDWLGKADENKTYNFFTIFVKESPIFRSWNGDVQKKFLKRFYGYIQLKVEEFKKELLKEI